MGWRYLLFCLGGLTLALWALRFFVFILLESPRYLFGVGNDHGAVEVIQHLAKANGATTDLTMERLREAAKPYQTGTVVDDDLEVPQPQKRKLLSESSDLSAKHVKALFQRGRWRFPRLC